MRGSAKAERQLWSVATVMASCPGYATARQTESSPSGPTGCRKNPFASTSIIAGLGCTASETFTLVDATWSTPDIGGVRDAVLAPMRSRSSCRHCDESLTYSPATPPQITCADALTKFKTSQLLFIYPKGQGNGYFINAFLFDRGNFRRCVLRRFLAVVSSEKSAP